MSDWEPETGAFALSRIYGQGWTAAKRMLAAREKDVGAADASAQNPYRGQEERLRWEKGFMDALGSPDVKMTMAGRKPWPRVSKKSPSQ